MKYANGERLRMVIEYKVETILGIHSCDLFVLAWIEIDFDVVKHWKLRLAWE